MSPVRSTRGRIWGINFLITRSNACALENVIALGQQLGAASVNILRPKPPTTEGAWLERESLDREEYRVLQERLRRLARPRSGTRITLDASLTFLLTDRSPTQLQRRGVWGCCAARRFATVLQDGRVLPCSHFRESDVGEGDVRGAWHRSRVFARFRAQEEILSGACARCPYLDLCKGCRAVVMALEGRFASSDPHCPRRRNAGPGR